MPRKNPHAVALGRKGGAATSGAKTRAARENAKGGGRKNPHAVALGREGGSVSSPAKRRAARENGKKGGRPKKGHASAPVPARRRQASS